MQNKPEFVCDAGRLVEEDTLVSGTAVTYSVTQDGHAAYQGDYEINSRSDSRPQDVRAFRQSQTRKGQAKGRLSRERLGGEMAIMFGPEMSPANAVRALKRLAKWIEEKGLLIGRDETGDFLIEEIDGSVG